MTSEKFSVWPGVTAALFICAALGVTALFIPPSMFSDPGFGFLAWRGTLLGHFNSVVSPDPSNIAVDTVVFLTTWSPGQYLLPGIISLSGLPLGIAITITTTLALFASLVGWIYVVRAILPRTEIALLIVVLIGCFRYSTLPFGIYNGGEILLQAITPWLILIGTSLPRMSFLRALVVGFFAVSIAFIAKLSGIIIAGAAFIAGGLLIVRSERKITSGTIGGAAGSIAALVLVYATFISRGWTAVSEVDWSLDFGAAAYAVIAPFGSGVSWTDLMHYLFLHPGRPVFEDPQTLSVFALIPALIVVTALTQWKPETEKAREIRAFALLFYAIVSLVFIFLYLRGAAISIDERFYRPTGTLLFVCAVCSVFSMHSLRWTKRALLGLCAVMALYGVTSFSLRAVSTANARTLDPMSRTNQLIVEREVIRYMRERYEQEQQEAIFVLPSPVIAATLPKAARIIATHLDFEPMEIVENRKYNGRNDGNIYLVMQNRIVESAKGEAFLASFTDYPVGGWERIEFESTSIFVQ